MAALSLKSPKLWMIPLLVMRPLTSTVPKLWITAAAAPAAADWLLRSSDNA